MDMIGHAADCQKLHAIALGNACKIRIKPWLPLGKNQLLTMGSAPNQMCVDAKK